VVDYLMSIPKPSPRVVAAVRNAVGWLERVRLYGASYDTAGGLRTAPGAGPLWARMYEIGTDRPIFSNRNGVKLYDWNQLTDRRHGYGWYTYAPSATLKTYAAWARKRAASPDRR
jgi:PelA/Pel-15E family pectate lyase